MSFFKEVTASLDLDGQTDIPRHPLTGISVLIVGAGPAGLYTALECWRKGHSPHVIDRTPSPSPAGDSFMMGPSAQQHIERTWPAVYAAALKTAPDPWMSFHKVTGERVAGPQPFSFNKGVVLSEDDEPAPDRVFRVSRPKFTAALLGQALALGVDVSFGKRVIDYFENENKGGVILEDGSKMDADVVVAADGLGTKSHKLINGHEIRAMSSNHSVLRTAYHVDNFITRPELDKAFPLREDGGALLQIWTADDLQIMVLRAPDTIQWHIMHNDIAGNSKESWSNHVSPEYVVDFLKENYPDLVGFINQTNFLKPESRKKTAGGSATPQPEYGHWIWAHNPERYAYENYGKALRNVVDGTPFQNTNIPPGYHYKPWTLHELYEKIEAGEKLEFEGDWS
ncbi:hypothetical protein N8I77_010831 [Diaporthe amygdali]|uniref:FAD-binding domain-containing protein n=1 Tax=Phomopsis amygdali TaxID=1214568 RepID=A0AAD9VZJ7_PHOAM|nr:hypothetical protein N8I77_010831 [Diaporthe amygdali]